MAVHPTNPSNRDIYRTEALLELLILKNCIAKYTLKTNKIDPNHENMSHNQLL